jgi:hypothetical protein
MVSIRIACGRSGPSRTCAARGLRGFANVLLLVVIPSSAAMPGSEPAGAGQARETQSWGTSGGMVHRTTKGTSGLSRTPRSRYSSGEMLGASQSPLAGYFLTQKRSWELRLGTTVETTENRKGGSRAVQAPLRSVRAGSVSQRSSTGMGGQLRSPTVRRNRRSRTLRLTQLG